MAFLLGYGSALEWLRMADDEQLSTQVFGLSPLSLESGKLRLNRYLKRLSTLTQPLQLVVAFSANRRPSAVACCHAVSLPYEDYHGLRITRGLYCSTPALTFLQMASVLDEVSLRMLGFELCGRYGYDAAGNLFERQQHCTPQLLTGRAEAVPRVRGRRKALAAATEVLGGAASPAVAALAIILTGDPTRGGFGLPAPELNHSLTVREAGGMSLSDNQITPDLLWESHGLAIECCDDHRRADSLKKMGFTVISAPDCLENAESLELLANKIAKQLGCTLPNVDAAVAQRRAELQQQLLRIVHNPSELLGF